MRVTNIKTLLSYALTVAFLINNYYKGILDYIDEYQHRGGMNSVDASAIQIFTNNFRAFLGSSDSLAHL